MSRQWATIVIAVLVVAGTAVLAALLQTPVYSGTASVQMQPPSTSDLLSPGAANDPATVLRSDADQITSPAVVQAARTRLGSAPHITVAPDDDTGVIEISARSTDRRDAAVIANTYARAFIQFHQVAEGDAARASASQTQVRIDDLQIQIDALNAQVNAAAAQAAATAGAAPPGASAPNSADARLISLIQQQAAFRQQLTQIQAQIQAAQAQTGQQPPTANGGSAQAVGGAQLARLATVPNNPVSPRPIRDLILSVLAGLALGVAAALLREHFDERVTTRDDVVQTLAGTPTMGLIRTIPLDPGRAPRPPATTMSADTALDPATEAYCDLRTSLQFVSLEHPEQSLRTILVTSAKNGSGTTTIVTNLAMALAQAGGRRVVVVDGNLRQPHLHQFFGLGNEAGFTSVLLGELPVYAVLQPVSGEPNLRILASGAVPANPMELLAGERGPEVLTAIQAEADIVLVDAPPVGGVDTAALNALVDATVLVVTVGTRRSRVRRAIEVLRQVDARVIGAVLNNVVPERSAGQPDEPNRSAPKPRRRQPDGGDDPSERQRVTT